LDPEEFFELTLEIGQKTIIKITKTGDTAGVDETIALLNRIYNGNATPILNDECVNLRKNIETEVGNFLTMLDAYIDELDQNIKNIYAKTICKLFSRGSAFAAFKRTIIKNNMDSFTEFKDALV
jgi:hypothetical protein